MITRLCSLVCALENRCICSLAGLNVITKFSPHPPLPVKSRGIPIPRNVHPAIVRLRCHHHRTMMRYLSLKTNTASVYRPVEVDPCKICTDESTYTSEITSTVEGWPTRPQRAVGARLWMIGDLVLLLMPVAFIGECHSIPRLRLTNSRYAQP
jgi:hypothetical protein